MVVTSVPRTELLLKKNICIMKKERKNRRKERKKEGGREAKREGGKELKRRRRELRRYHISELRY